MADTVLDYTPIPTIREFHESSATYRCIVGPVGSGKTCGATVEIFYYLPRYVFQKYGIKKTRWVIVRNSYRELEDTTQKTVLDWFPWGTMAKGDQIFTVKHPEGLEVEALFRSCDNPDDIKKFKSLEITGYWIDESIEVAEQVKLMLKNRIGRYPRKSPVKYGIETTNPPDVEHPTYYHYDWQSKCPGPIPERKNKDQNILQGHIGFWQPPGENDQNLPKDYYLDLIQAYAGNPDWIDRYIKGKPGITLKGKAVYNNFRSSLHVSQTPLKWTGSTLFAGWDNTGNCPACAICQMPTAGMIQVLAEYHTERMGIVDFVKMVVADRNVRFPNAEWIEWGDPAGEAKFSKVGGGLTSNAELMRDEAGIKLKSSEQNWEARRESVEGQLGRLVAGQPAMMIDLSCIRLINGFLGGYAYPEQGLTGIYGDKPIKNKYSHIHDALQYVCVMLTKNIYQDQRNRVDRGQRRKQGGFSNWDKKSIKHDDGKYKEVYVN
jgi:hypothetical protein